MKTNEHHFASIIERLSAQYKEDNSFEQSIANYPGVKIAENFRQRNLLSPLRIFALFKLTRPLYKFCASYKIDNL